MIGVQYPPPAGPWMLAGLIVVAILVAIIGVLIIFGASDGPKRW